ncbi:MAG: hypothetical protein WCT05_08275 [Lentisphaeria bacterium]
MAIVQRKKRKKFNILRENKDLSSIYPDLPQEDECFKVISCGGFSSIAFIYFVSQKSKINWMYASSLRIGRKHLMALDMLHKRGKLGYCKFVVGKIMEQDKSQKVKKYQYYNDMESVCRKNGWDYMAINNHSKVILFDTDCGKFVLETSSNLNENPSIEQFSFEKDQELFDDYLEAFGKIFSEKIGEEILEKKEGG